MSLLLIKEPLFRGVRDIDGLLLSDDDPTRIAALWSTGTRLHRVDDHLLVLRFPQAVRWRCEVGRESALVLRSDRLTALPVDEEVVGSCAAGDVIRLRHGRLVIGHPRPAVLTELFDVSDWAVVQPLPPNVTGPADRPPTPPEPTLAARPLAFDTRARLGAQAQPSPREQRQQRRLAPPALPAGGSGRGWTWRSERLQQRRAQQYLDDLTRLFAAGDIEAALRRAIPFGGDGSGGLRRFLAPRNDLVIKPYRPAASSSIDLDPGLQAELQQRYRSAFARLEADGRALDAAFVLADLLDRTTEACSFLERHGKIALAAQLAEARSNDHGEVVRLWWRAGDRQRAVAIARRHACFAPAVMRLEQTANKEEADGLRRTWMAHLLDAGDIVTAFDVGASLTDPAASATRRRLVELGVERGGPLRARMLARHLRSGAAQPHPALDTLLVDEHGARDRVILATELAKEQASVDQPHAVRSLLRGLFADGADVDKPTLDRLVTLTADPVLRTDLPPIAQRARPTPVDGEALWIGVDGDDRGQVPVTDARLLPDGRLLVALGDLGLQVVNRRGRVEARIDVPAHTVVTSDNGLRALAIRPLGDDVVALHVVSLPEQRHRALGEVLAAVWADTFDGAQWFVARNTQLWSLDVLAGSPTALWRAEDHREPIFAITRSPRDLGVGSFAYGSNVGGVRIIRRYSFPDLRMVAAEDVHDAGDGAILSVGGVIPGAVAGDDAYTCRLEPGETTTAIVVTRTGAATPSVVVQLHGTTDPIVRLDHGTLVVADGYGRIEAVDLGTGERRSYRSTI